MSNNTPAVTEYVDVDLDLLDVDDFRKLSGADTCIRYNAGAMEMKLED